MVAVLVCHHVLLRQRAAAGTELVDEHLEEIGVEVGGLVDGAVERPDVAGRGSAAGLNLTVKQRGMRRGVPTQQLRPDPVHRVRRRHDPAFHIFVGVRAGLAVAQVVSGRVDAPGADLLLLRYHRARVDAEEQRDHHDQQSAEPAADRDSATGPAATARRDVARVDLHTLVEGHRIAPSPRRTGFDPGPSSFAHYDLGVAVVVGHSTVVHTGLGDLRGATEGGVGVWRGVPYAEQPVGERRFLAPAPLRPWTGVRDALEHGPLPPQSKSFVGGGRDDPKVRDEACLTLTVWSPDTSGSLPVMVWIPGGAFVFGAGQFQLYNGSRLAANGNVVVVNITYRIGVFGGFELSDLGDGFDDNLALRDQMAALRLDPRQHRRVRRRPRPGDRVRRVGRARRRCLRCWPLPPLRGCSAARSRRAPRCR